MQHSYAVALKGLLISEGGWSNHPADPGGATMYGIIQREYDAWRALRKLPQQSVRKITMAEVETIYDKQYAIPLHFDALPAGVDYTVFDYGVNSGVSRGAKELQRVLKVVADGHIGVITLAAAKAADPVATINAVCDRRLAFLRGLKTFPVFGKGWTARVARVRKDSLALAKAA